MAASEPARKRTRAPHDDDLLAAACAIVAADGWAGITLRPLAQRLDVSVTVLSNHYGTRDDVMAAICRAACAAEARLAAGWHGRMDRLGALSPGVAADLADGFLEQLAVGQRDFSLLFVEVMQACAWDAPLRAAFAPWLAARAGFWNAFGRQAGVPATLADSGWLHAYFIDELVYSVVLNHLPSYRMLRRLALRRLFGGWRAEAGDAALFGVLYEELEHAAGDIAVAHGVQVASGWPGRAARACALLLTERGVSALTHRAIAALAEVPHTTLSYRFATQQDLVIAGLEYIITHLVRAVDTGTAGGDLAAVQARVDATDSHRLDVGRATFAVAIAAARMPELVACAADMRRRRGINLVKLLQQLAPPPPGLDLLSAQIMSIGLIGLTNTMPAGAAASAVIGTAYDAVVASMRLQEHSTTRL